MKATPMKAIFSPRTLIAALALTLGVAATAFAMAPGGERCGHGGSRMEQGMAQGMQAMSRLHGELKLDAKQEALWQEAEKAGKEGMSGMREQMQKQRATALALLEQPGADLRAVLKQMDEARSAGRQQHEAKHAANRDRWLAVYDSLNAEQKEKARLFLKSKIERSEHRPGSGRK